MSFFAVHEAAIAMEGGFAFQRVDWPNKPTGATNLMQDYSEKIEILSYQPGEIIFRENEVSFYFLVIQSGQVEVFKTTPDGREVQLTIVDDRHAIGEFAMIDRQPRSASARAVGEVRVAKVSEEMYGKLLEDLPDWARSMISALVRRIRNTNAVVKAQSTPLANEVSRQMASVEYDAIDGDTFVDVVPDLGDDKSDIGQM